MNGSVSEFPIEAGDIRTLKDEEAEWSTPELKAQKDRTKSNELLWSWNVFQREGSTMRKKQVTRIATTWRECFWTMWTELAISGLREGNQRGGELGGWCWGTIEVEYGRIYWSLPRPTIIEKWGNGKRLNLFRADEIIGIDLKDVGNIPNDADRPPSSVPFPLLCLCFRKLTVPIKWSSLGNTLILYTA